MNTIRRIFPNGLEGRSVLDCACNCGAYLFWAKELGAGKCFGFDAREHWIRQACFLAEHREGPGEDIEFRICELYELPKLGLEPFDIVLFNGIFYHLPYPVSGLKLGGDLARELVMVSTATIQGFPDGMMVLSGESPTKVMSGVYGLKWLPAGPEVLTRVLNWLGFPETRRSWWAALDDLSWWVTYPKYPPGHKQNLDRLEMVAARDLTTFEAFDAASGSSAARVREIIETATPPGSHVLLAGERDDELVSPKGRHASRFPEPDRGDAFFQETEDSRLIDQLEQQRAQGADHVAFPAGGLAWLQRRPELQRHLEERYRAVARSDACLIFSLRRASPR